MKYFDFHVYWFEYLTELNYINISIILQRLVVVFKILYLNPIQGCIINRICTTVDVEALNDYQSNFFNYSIIGKIWCTTQVGRSYKWFLYVTYFWGVLQKYVYHILIHSIPRMKIIIDERTVSSFFLLHWHPFHRETCQLIGRFQLVTR